MFSTILDYFTGLMMCDSNSQSKRRFWFWLSIIVNLGFLGVFKYFNFFSESFVNLLSLFGIKSNLILINVILPVGISFYTFHGLSYVIDIYYGRIKAERNFIDYGVFVSYFPLLVAGPIERATHLLPQIQRKRVFDYHMAKSGLLQILWGFFKKVLIADNCAEFANLIFNNHEQMSGSSLFLGALFFTFQIYGDFSGYSDIALGVSKLFGIELLRNFAFPYFSRDIAEFWRRWHISLSSWFRDYLYIPLGGSKVDLSKRIRNTFIIFLVSGFWHGANWTFIVWGGLNALYFLPLLLSNNNRTNLEIVAAGKYFPSVFEFFQILRTFLLTVLAWIFFRAENLTHAKEILAKIFSVSLFEPIHFIGLSRALLVVILVLFFLIIEWIGREKQFGLQFMEDVKRPYIRWSFYIILIALIGLFMPSSETPFIYFQF
jgi:D-alanyl-lipoteichoic acid acyltransferase DltB (MBOAT superfamily)